MHIWWCHAVRMAIMALCTVLILLLGFWNFYNYEICLELILLSFSHCSANIALRLWAVFHNWTVNKRDTELKWFSAWFLPLHTMIVKIKFAVLFKVAFDVWPVILDNLHTKWLHFALMVDWLKMTSNNFLLQYLNLDTKQMPNSGSEQLNPCSSGPFVIV